MNLANPCMSTLGDDLCHFLENDKDGEAILLHSIDILDAETLIYIATYLESEHLFDKLQLMVLASYGRKAQRQELFVHIDDGIEKQQLETKFENMFGRPTTFHGDIKKTFFRPIESVYVTETPYGW